MIDILVEVTDLQATRVRIVPVQVQHFEWVGAHPKVAAYYAARKKG